MSRFTPFLTVCVVLFGLLLLSTSIHAEESSLASSSSAQSSVQVTLDSELDHDLETEMEDWLDLEAATHTQQQAMTQDQAEAEDEAEDETETEDETEVDVEAETETEAEAESEVDAERRRRSSSKSKSRRSSSKSSSKSSSRKSKSSKSKSSKSKSSKSKSKKSKSSKSKSSKSKSSKSSSKKSKNSKKSVARRLSKKANRVAKKIAKKLAAKAAKLGKPLSKKQLKKQVQKLKAKSLKKAINKLSGKKAAKSNKKAKRTHDEKGRRLDRYRLPTVAKTKLESQMSAKEKAAFKLAVRQARLAKKRVSDAKKRAAKLKANHIFAAKKAAKMKKEFQAASKQAAASVKGLAPLRAKALKGGSKSQAQLTAATTATSKLQQLAVEKQNSYRAQKAKVGRVLAEYLKAKKDIEAAKKNVHENGYDELLNKVDSDVAKLDKALFGGKKLKAQSKLVKKLKARSLKAKAKAKARKLRAKAGRYTVDKPRMPRMKYPIVWAANSVDNGMAAQQARRNALEAVQEDIDDNAKFGSISERHLKTGLKAHAETDRVRENFYDHQEKLYFKKLIKPQHRFID